MPPSPSGRRRCRRSRTSRRSGRREEGGRRPAGLQRQAADVTMGMNAFQGFDAANFTLLERAIGNANAQATANNYVAANATLDAAAVQLRAAVKSWVDTRQRASSPPRPRTPARPASEARARHGQDASRRCRHRAGRAPLERGRDGGRDGGAGVVGDRAHGAPARLLRDGTDRDADEDRRGQGQRVPSPTAERASMPWSSRPTPRRAAT